jgi:organic radical activating enzyme
MNKGVSSQRTENIPDPNKNLTPDYFKLKRVDIRWSNTCNLSCNYCMPYFSSKWATILGTKEFHPISSNIENQIFQFIEENLETTTDLMLLGGEPFLQKQNEKLLDLLPNSSICLITNLSIPIESNSIAQRLMKEPYVQWGVSFENIGDKFEYVRHGASWKIVENNLQYLKKHNKKVNLFPLYCIYSAFDLVELYDNVVALGYVSKIEWQLLTDDNLDVFNMPAELKSLAINEIDLCVAKYPTAPGIDVLIALRTTLQQSMSDTITKNINFVKWTDNLEKNQMKKEKLFSDLWDNIYIKIKQYI